MDTQKPEDLQADGQGDESLNISSTSADQSPEGEQGKHRKGGIHNNALFAASMGRPATAQVDPHHNRDLAQTGTNIVYEGPTAPGGGGSVGSGFTSGQSGVDTSISSESDYDQAAIGKHTTTPETDEEITDDTNATEDGNK